MISNEDILLKMYKLKIKWVIKKEKLNISVEEALEYLKNSV